MKYFTEEAFYNLIRFHLYQKNGKQKPLISNHSTNQLNIQKNAYLREMYKIFQA